MEQRGRICGINGPVITVASEEAFQMMEKVYVGEEHLIGEVISIQGQHAIVQVYESTTGLRLGEAVYSTRTPLSVELAPGIIGGVIDGIQRPLQKMEEATGHFIGRGVDIHPIDRAKEWPVRFCVEPGAQAFPGMIFASVQETELISHKLMIPSGISGRILSVRQDGLYKVEDALLEVETESGRREVSMLQYWPVRMPRPFAKRLRMDVPLITGQRVIDTFFPIAKGGTAAIPGGFGTGKTMTQHQLAKWSDADIIVYIGCGERGNEITEVLEDFPKLVDPKSGRSLMERTVLIANTSNMPVAAREASIYTGITLAEYYRDMGYHVAIMADSTSRWAEALREISGRLEEMPAEEGFPAYLPSRLAQFYERAGYVETNGHTEGSVSIIGAVSPQGGDFSEPVTQNTKRFIRCFWGLDKDLAYSRHYPAIHWLNSYSEYIDDLQAWFQEYVSHDFLPLRNRMMTVLQEENKLMEIVKLIGSDVLPEEQKLTLEIAKAIRLGFLQQNAFHDVDTYVPLIKQREMMKVIAYAADVSQKLVANGVPTSRIVKSHIFDDIIQSKYQVGNEDMSGFDAYYRQIDEMDKEIRDSYKLFERKRSS